MRALPDLPPDERRLFVRLAAVNALSLGTFGVVAPAAQSLFLAAFDLALLPRAWLAIMLASVLAAGLLRRLGRRFGPSRCLSGVAAASAACLAALLFLRRLGFRPANFLVFVWRDVYVLLLLETLWTVVNISPLARRATGLYGVLSAAGTGTTIVAALAGAGLVARVGTEGLLWGMVPILCAVAGLAARLPHRALAGDGTPWDAAVAPGADGRPAAWRSPRVAAIFGLIASGHVALSLFDYQVNLAVQRFLPEADVRTQAMSALHSATNLLSLGLQLASGRILAWAPVGAALAAAPAAMGLGLVATTLLGGLAPVLATRLVVKGLDHSLYRVAKERLWARLSYHEKVDGKALVDVAGSRVAKGLASLALLCLGPAAAGRTAWVGCLAAAAAWAGLALAQRPLSSRPACAPASPAPSRGPSRGPEGSDGGPPRSCRGPRPPRT